MPNHVASVSSLLLNMFSAFQIPCFYCQFTQLKMPRPHSQNTEKEHCPVTVNHSFFLFLIFYLLLFSIYKKWGLRGLTLHGHKLS